MSDDIIVHGSSGSDNPRDWDPEKMLDSNSAFEIMVPTSNSDGEISLALDQFYFNLRRDAEVRGYTVKETVDENGDKNALFTPPERPKVSEVKECVHESRSRSRNLGLMAAMMGAFGATSGDFDLMPSGLGRLRRRSSSRCRHDPDRPKTEEDLKKIEASEDKQARKEARRRRVRENAEFMQKHGKKYDKPFGKGHRSKKRKRKGKK